LAPGVGSAWAGTATMTNRPASSRVRVQRGLSGTGDLLVGGGYCNRSAIAFRSENRASPSPRRVRDGTTVCLIGRGLESVSWFPARWLRSATRLRAREYAIADAGVRHSADVQEHATALFVTAGIGTQIRDR